MTSPLMTGSGIERHAICPGSAVLPGAGTVSDDAARGTAIHAFLEAVNTKGREAALAAVPDDLRPVCEALDVAKLPTDPLRFAAEVAFAYDTVTGKARELGRGIGRRYDCAPTEVAGTTDVIALLDDDGVFVSDFKSGWSRRTAARDSLHLRFYSLAAARAYGRSRAVVQVIRVFDDGETWTDEASLDAFDLDSFALDLAALASGIERDRKLYAEGVEPDLVEGSHCKWCPAYARCPAKDRLLTAAGNIDATTLPDLITPEVAAKAYERLAIYKAAVARAEEILKDYARANPIPLADGFVYGVRQDQTKKLDGHVAMLALREALGPWAESAIDVSVTQAGVERAAKLYVEQNGGTIAAKKRELLDMIAERGGVKVVTAPKLVAHRAKKEAA